MSSITKADNDVDTIKNDGVAYIKQVIDKMSEISLLGINISYDECA
ncbi:MAG: hypothetical protein AB8U25_06865 [Rickettsiales endosymbiont of Dermacentor nuttalli]